MTSPRGWPGPRSTAGSTSRCRCGWRSTTAWCSRWRSSSAGGHGAHGPFFINSVAPPFTPAPRFRALGEALGRYLVRSGQAGAAHRVRWSSPTNRRCRRWRPRRRTSSKGSSPAGTVRGGDREAAGQRPGRRERFAAGEGNLKALNPDWDAPFLDQLAANDLDAIDAYTNNDQGARRPVRAGDPELDRRLRRAVHSRPVRITYRYYRPIRSSSPASASPPHSPGPPARPWPASVRRPQDAPFLFGELRVAEHPALLQVRELLELC